jgi:hypothetical protein
MNFVIVMIHRIEGGALLHLESKTGDSREGHRERKALRYMRDAVGATEALLAAGRGLA